FDNFIGEDFYLLGYIFSPKFFIVFDDAVNGTSVLSTILKTNGKNEHLYLIADFDAIASSLSTCRYFALFSPICGVGNDIIQVLVSISETASRTEKNIQLCTDTLEFLEAVVYEKDTSSCVSQTSAFHGSSF
ncbi:hypothetical protein STEG23_014748, partial [Scotinomys teguina]